MDPNDPSGGSRPGWVPPPDPHAPDPQPTWPAQPTPPTWPAQPGGWQPPSVPPGQAAWGTPARSWGPEPKRKRFGWLALILAFLIGGFISFVVTIGGIVAIGLALGTPDVIAGTHPAPAEGADEVAVGDCLSEKPSVASVVDQSDVVDCDEPHRAEVAAVIEIPGGEQIPGNEDLQLYLDEACTIAFESYVGTDYESSVYDYAAVVPSDEAWEDGDRTAFCLIDTFGTLAGEGTVRGSGD